LETRVFFSFLTGPKKRYFVGADPNHPQASGIGLFFLLCLHARGINWTLLPFSSYVLRFKLSWMKNRQDFELLDGRWNYQKWTMAGASAA
jgi:hypothetical protein